MTDNDLRIFNKEKPFVGNRGFSGMLIREFEDFSFHRGVRSGYDNGHVSIKCVYFNNPFQRKGKVVFDKTIYIYEGTVEYDYVNALLPRNVDPSEWIVNECELLSQVNKWILRTMFEQENVVEYFENLIEEERKDAAEKAIEKHNEVLRALLGIRESIY